jgi:hypothetical protein
MEKSVSSVAMSLLLEFEVAFPGEKPLTPKEYLKGGNMDVVLKAAAAFLAFKQHESKFDDIKDFLRMFFSPGNAEFAKKIFSNIAALKNKNSIRVINPYTSLKLFEYFFSLPQEEPTQTDLEFEQNLFKAYLGFNSEFTKAQDYIGNDMEDYDEEARIYFILLTMQYPIGDKTNFDIREIWISQLYKAFYFFEFLESTDKTKPLLASFLAHFKCESWKVYLKRLLPLTLSAVKNQNESFTDIVISKGATFKEDCEFVEKLAVQETDPIEQNDFLTTRAKPFYKVSEGDYRIIFNLFVVEKIFKGLYFFLRDINQKLPENQRISNWRSHYCDEFSEKILLYKIIPLIYPVKSIQFTGQELVNMHIGGGPDYYLRKGKDILLFESKDFLILADLKKSFDFAVYEQEFMKTLYLKKTDKGKKKPAAVMQLIGSIKQLLLKKFEGDTNYWYKDVHIYPIIITHDHQYDIPGLHELVNSWFFDELAILKDAGLFINKVKPVTIINLDILLCYQASFSDGVYLHDIIKEHNKLKDEKMPKSYVTLNDRRNFFYKKAIPFSFFFRDYIENHNLKRAPNLKKLIEKLLG